MGKFLLVSTVDNMPHMNIIPKTESNVALNYHGKPDI